MKTRQTEQAQDDFIAGFATATGLPRNEATEQWAWFARQLSDSDLRAVEAGGYDAGLEQGTAYTRLYPALPEEDTPCPA